MPIFYLYPDDTLVTYINTTRMSLLYSTNNVKYLCVPTRIYEMYS